MPLLKNFETDGGVMRRIGARGIFAVLALVAGTRPALPGDYNFLGATMLTYNDMEFGHDRWQTGGASISAVFGPSGLNGLPASPGEFLELRLRGQVITPDNFTSPAAWDRRPATAITATLNTHFTFHGAELSGGAGFAVTGPQTHLFQVQNAIHWLTPANDPFMPGWLQATQIPNAVYPAIRGEAAYRLRLRDGITLRPFAEVRGGVENIARIGADVFLGPGFDHGVLARGGTTGFPYQLINAPGPGVASVMFGADAAYVASSALLPGPTASLEPLRLRARAGFGYEARHVSLFAGGAWLGPEFAGQPRTGQFVAATQMRIRF